MTRFTVVVFLVCLMGALRANEPIIDFRKEEIPVSYHLMNHNMFQTIVVGNTVVGMTRQSHSVYMLYFASDGSCDLWKQNRVYLGRWWLEKDEFNRDYVRAIWPQYSSLHPQSLFSPDNPRYGTATAIWYYVDSTHSKFLVANRKFQAQVLLVPGRAF
jgi:hypothetical protein